MFAPRLYKPPGEIKEPKYKLSDIGGMDLRELRELLERIQLPEVCGKLKPHFHRGFLLQGPPGCGKTILAQAIAGYLSFKFIEVSASELIAGVPNETIQQIKELFEQAINCAPCVLFIDQIDAISSAQNDMEQHIVSQLIRSFNDLSSDPISLKVIIIGATSRPEVLNPALRMEGGFHYEISLGIPNREQRKQILIILCKNLTLDREFNYCKVAELTPGYVGADLLALTTRAASIALKRICLSDLQKKRTQNIPSSSNNIPVIDLCDDTPAENENAKKAEENNKTGASAEDNNVPEVEETIDVDEISDVPVSLDSLSFLSSHSPSFKMQDLCITMKDFEEALRVVQPPAEREGFITIPDVTWEDIGSLRRVRKELQLAILAPLNYPEQLQTLRLKSPSGVLLYGPPGCGKTLLAKAVAKEAAINFISVKGPHVTNMYVGETENIVQQCFERARNSAPCIIFFDEFDSLFPKISDSAEGSGGTRMVNQFLTEMDSIQGRWDVFIMAATSRPDIIDPAILRPGRFDTIVYVGLPREKDRVQIMEVVTKQRTLPALADDVDLKHISKLTKGYTGADLASLIRRAALLVLEEWLSNSNSRLRPRDRVTQRHLLIALDLVQSSVSLEQQKFYHKLQMKYAAQRAQN